jgi:lipoyl(octanoyl) transferase
VISVVQLGQVSYAEGLRLQRKLVDLRKAGAIGDVLLLLEHSPVITLGRNAQATNVLASTEMLAARGVEVFECDRGGDVTFHGPGQIVGYPIFDLRQHDLRQHDLRGHDGSQEESSQFSVLSSQKTGPGSLSPGRRKTLGAVDYVRRLEEVLIRTCGDFGIPTKRVAGLTGVWTETNRNEAGASERKIAAIGVHISRSVTSHGFALNVNTDLDYFDLIVPCGITAKPVTSMQKELGKELNISDVSEAISRNMGVVFASQMLWLETIDALLGNTVGVPVKVPSELRELRGEDELFLA